MKLPKGFIGEGNGNMVNIDCITDVKYVNGKCIAIAILGVEFDRRNFSKKILHVGLLDDLNETIKANPKREAKLYKFNLENYDRLKEKGFRLEFLRLRQAVKDSGLCSHYPQGLPLTVSCRLWGQYL